MERIEQVIDSREVAKMIDKEHCNLLRDIRRYVEQFNEAKIGSVDFFKRSTYGDPKGEIRPCYRMTKKGCEFIAHKLTGTKGTLFTARYINRFHEMEEQLKQEKPERPWFVRRFRGKDIVLWRDFSSILGVDVENRKPKGWSETMVGGLDFNGYSWKNDRDKFMEEYGFDFGEGPRMTYFYLCGVPKAMRLFENDRKSTILAAGKELLLNGIRGEEKPEEQRKIVQVNRKIPLQVTFALDLNRIETEI